MVKHNDDGKLAFHIYRKLTSTGRTITGDSYHYYSHKIVSYHCMIHRLLNVLMNENAFEVELDEIYDIGKINLVTAQIRSTGYWIN